MISEKGNIRQISFSYMVISIKNGFCNKQFEPPKYGSSKHCTYGMESLENKKTIWRNCDGCKNLAITVFVILLIMVQSFQNTNLIKINILYSSKSDRCQNLDAVTERLSPVFGEENKSQGNESI